MLHKARKVWSRTWPFLWFVWIILLSLRLSWRRIFHTRGLLHFPGHALIFAVSAFVVCRSQRSFRQRIILCFAVIDFGFLLEVAECASFGSRFEWQDVVADACGVLIYLAVSACVVFARTKKPGNPRNNEL